MYVCMFVAMIAFIHVVMSLVVIQIYMHDCVHGGLCLSVFLFCVRIYVLALDHSAQCTQRCHMEK